MATLDPENPGELQGFVEENQHQDVLDITVCVSPKDNVSSFCI